MWETGATTAMNGDPEEAANPTGRGSATEIAGEDVVDEVDAVTETTKDDTQVRVVGGDGLMRRVESDGTVSLFSMSRLARCLRASLTCPRA